MKPLYIIGSGGFSKQVLEIVEEINTHKKEYELVGIIDDDKSKLGKEVLGYKIIGDTNYLKCISENNVIYAVIAIADGKVREKLSKNLLKVRWINLIHPKAIISKYTTMGEGNVICGGVIINPECEIGNHCNINISCTLGHDIVLDDYSTLMPGCNISGNVKIKSYSTVGTGSCIIQNKTINENSYIGAGSVVIEDVEKNSLYVGVPAKKIKEHGFRRAL
ncbi:acetyltransferase [Peribacillus frigoritolerans]|uniref:acetyltransferase n=1 Tax=Peribacillus frigoritolerans TaxID=450367 RepID=UPI0007BECDAD|nr:acetyltransferase [Peribacillus frigoritolerans]